MQGERVNTETIGKGEQQELTKPIHHTPFQPFLRLPSYHPPFSPLIMSCDDIELPYLDSPLDSPSSLKYSIKDKPNHHDSLQTSKIILGEIQNVISAMRSNSRWMEGSRYGKKLDPLMVNLMLLKQNIESNIHKPQSILMSGYLSPFLDIIRSVSVSGPITNVSLNSLLKFVQYGYFDLAHGEDSLIGLESLLKAVIDCKIEATDNDTDQVIIFRGLKIMESVCYIDTGLLLGDQIVYEMVSFCFFMSIQSQYSALLRKAAEMTLSELFRFAFRMAGSSTQRLAALRIFSDTQLSKFDALPLRDIGLSHQHDSSFHSSSKDSFISGSSNPGMPKVTHFNARGVPFVKDPHPALSVTVGSSNASTIVPPTQSSINQSFTTSTDATSHTGDSQNGSPSPASNQAAASSMGAPLISAFSNTPLNAPFGQILLQNLMRFLASIINPSDNNTPDTSKYLALNILNILIEVKPSSLSSNPVLLEVLSNAISRFLLTSLKTESNTSVLGLIIRVCTNLFVTMRTLMKFQLEMFLRTLTSFLPPPCLIESDGESNDSNPTSPSTPNQKRTVAQPTRRNQQNSLLDIPVRTEQHMELALECLNQLCRDSDFPIDLLLLFDCHPQESNLFEYLVGFLTRVAQYVPSVLPGKRWEEFNMQDLPKGLKQLAHSALISLTTSMVNRSTMLRELKSSPQFGNSASPIDFEFHGAKLPTSGTIQYIRKKKMIQKKGAALFNKKWKEGMAFFEANGLISSPPTEQQVVHLFKTNPFLSKAMIGEFFGDRKEFNYAVLKHYILEDKVNWKTRTFAQNFRNFLESFRLPGEAPVIERIIDLWSKIYYEAWNVEKPETKTSESDSEPEQHISQISPNTDIPQSPNVTDSSSQSSGPSHSLPSSIPNPSAVENTHPFFKSLDACFFVCMSIILLNVDMYNPQVKENRRMSVDQYVNNLKGQNAKTNFDAEFLRSIYANIRESEIRIAEEHIQAASHVEVPANLWHLLWLKQQEKIENDDSLNFIPLGGPKSGSNGTNDNHINNSNNNMSNINNTNNNQAQQLAFKSNLKHQTLQDAILSCAHLTGIYDEMLYDLIWEPVLWVSKEQWKDFANVANLEQRNVISYPFYSSGLLASLYKNIKAFDSLISDLADLTTILLRHTDYSFEVKFTQDRKAQTACHILFHLAQSHIHMIRDGWKSINDIMIALDGLGVLPPILDEVLDDSTFQFKSLPPPASPNGSDSNSKDHNKATQQQMPQQANSISSFFSNIFSWGQAALASNLSDSGASILNNDSTNNSDGRTSSIGSGSNFKNQSRRSNSQQDFPKLERFVTQTKEILVQCGLPDLIKSCSTVEIDSLLFLLKVLILGSTPIPSQHHQNLSINKPLSNVSSSKTGNSGSTGMRPNSAPPTQLNQHDKPAHHPSMSSSSSSVSSLSSSSNELPEGSSPPVVSTGEESETSSGPVTSSISDNTIPESSNTTPSSSQTPEDSIIKSERQLSESSNEFVLIEGNNGISSDDHNNNKDYDQLSSETSSASISGNTSSAGGAMQPFTFVSSAGLPSESNRQRKPPQGSNVYGGKQKNRFDDAVALFCVDMLAQLVLLNPRRIKLVWPVVSNHYVEIIQASDKPSPLTERAIMNLLLVVAKLLPVAIGEPQLIYRKISDDDHTSTSSVSIPISNSTNHISSLPTPSQASSSANFKAELSSTTVALAMTQLLHHQLKPSTLGESLSIAYSHRISHAMRVILRRNVASFSAAQASQPEWSSLLNCAYSNMFDTQEHIENFVDVLSASIVRGNVKDVLDSSASSFGPQQAALTSPNSQIDGSPSNTNNNNKKQSELDDSDDSGDYSGSGRKSTSSSYLLESGPRINSSSILSSSGAIESSTSLLNSANLLAVHQSLLRVFANPKTNLDALSEAMECSFIVLSSANRILSSGNVSPAICLANVTVPLLIKISDLADDHRSLVRQLSLLLISKCLNAEFFKQQMQTARNWQDLFDVLLLPLMDKVISWAIQYESASSPKGSVGIPQNLRFSSSKEATEQTKMQSITLLSKTFLHCLQQFEPSILLRLWTQILLKYGGFVGMDLAARQGALKHDAVSSRSDSSSSSHPSEEVEQTVSEAIMNGIMMMHQEKLLVTVTEESSDGSELDAESSDSSRSIKYLIWTETWRLTDQIAPHIRDHFKARTGISPPPATTIPVDPVSSNSPPNTTTPVENNNNNNNSSNNNDDDGSASSASNTKHLTETTITEVSATGNDQQQPSSSSTPPTKIQSSSSSSSLLDQSAGLVSASASSTANQRSNSPATPPGHVMEL